MPMIEVIGKGFKGATDERVLWVEAPSFEYVRSILNGTPFFGIYDMNVKVQPDYVLPADDAALIDKLKSFVVTK